MTNGIAAGALLADQVFGREPSWADVYRPSRFRFEASKGDLLSHNTHAMKHLLTERLKGHSRFALRSIGRGQATVVDSEDGPVGVYRDEDGALHAVSVSCTHMDCLLEWNDGEQSWDCPCHGSRFDVDGRVLDTPAVEDLRTYDEDEFEAIELE